MSIFLPAVRGSFATPGSEDVYMAKESSFDEALEGVSIFGSVERV
jgi:hypothetical protein